MDAEWWYGVWEIKIKGDGLVLIKYERYWWVWYTKYTKITKPADKREFEYWTTKDISTDSPIKTVPPPDQPRHRGDHQAAALPQPRPLRQQGGQGQAQGTIVTIVLLSNLIWR